LSGSWEIFLIALVAVFLVLRLRSVLGRRTGNERPPPAHDPFSAPPAGDSGQPGWNQGTRPAADAPATAGGNVIELPRPERPAAPPTPSAGGALTISQAAQPGVDRIRQADPSFDPREFLRGAREAFEMIVAAFARGDSAALRSLLSDGLFAGFDGAIRARQAARETQQTTVIGFEACELSEADLRERLAVCTVRFVSEQVNVTRNAEGTVIDGSPNEVTKVTDLWTFQRDTGSPDPNWLLVATSGD
jgi:predicted lipid-binding transport protein (Tim44 family)